MMGQNTNKRFVSQEKKNEEMRKLLIVLYSVLAFLIVIVYITKFSDDGVEFDYEIQTQSCIYNEEIDNTETKKESIETTKVYLELEEILPDEKVNDEYKYNISEKEKIMLAKLVYAEAGGEKMKGKIAVAAVVLNRYNSYQNKESANNISIESVINKKNQFASIKNISMQDLEKNPDCFEAVERACKGEDPTREKFPEGAMYFYNPDLVSGYQAEIREGIEILEIGAHNFHYDFEKVK